MKLEKSEINHLRRLLAWMRVEYCLDENAQRGGLTAIKEMLDAGHISQEQAYVAMSRNADQIRQVPAYLRQGIKMLTKSLQTHDGVKGSVVDVATRDVQSINSEAMGDESECKSDRGDCGVGGYCKDCKLLK